MTAKRIRCTCGRIYDPVKHKKCPDCGAETLVATKVEPSVPLPREQRPTMTEPKQESSSTTPIQFPIPVNQRTLMLIGAGVIFLLLLVLMIRGCGKEKTAQRDRVSPPPGASPTASTSGKPTVIVIPPSGGGETKTADLSAMIASAAAGATIKVPPGVYPGGLVANRAIKIVGDSGQGGQVLIQGEGKSCLVVKSSGVAVANVQFSCNGIGMLPAIVLIDDAELGMEGCKVQSSTVAGLMLGNKASIKATGSTFTAARGFALSLNPQARANLTQCSFSDDGIGLFMAGGANAELHSCAFERIGNNVNSAAIISLEGEKTVLIADDCHFNENNAGISVKDKASITITNSIFKNNLSAARGNDAPGLLLVRAGAHAVLDNNAFAENGEGVAVRQGGTLEMQKCQFNGNGARQSREIIPAYLPLSVSGEGSTATVRNTVFANSTLYAANVFSGGTLTLEETEISGSRSAGLVVGDRNNTTPAHAEIKRSHFDRNGTGIGVFAGSSANVEDSGCKENQDGIIALDRQSQLKLTKTAIVSNKDFGLYVHANAQASAIDCDIQNNAKGAQSGMARKSAERASLTLENCRFGGNRVYGAGASTQSELVLKNCSFDGTDKMNISKEHGAIVQTDMAVSESTPEETAEPKKDRNQVRRQPTPPPNRRPSDQEIYRLFRRFRP